MNRYPLWKYLMVLGTLLLGALYAAPNLFGDNPAIQISAKRGAAVDEALEARTKSTLQAAGIEPIGLERDGNTILIRFASPDQQLKAQDALTVALGSSYSTALNLAPATPAWLRRIGGQPMYLGLDLRGGIHFLMEVDMPAVVRQSEERYVSELRGELRDQKVRFRSMSREDHGGIRIEFADEAARTAAEAAISSRFPDLVRERTGTTDAPALRLTLAEQYVRDTRRTAVQQNITTLRNRINELGVAEPVIQQQGESRIVVQLPGIQDSGRAKEILGATATLEFRMVDTEGSLPEAMAGKVPIGSRLYDQRSGGKVLLKKRVLLTGDHIIGAASGLEQQSGTPAVFISLDGQGARAFSVATRENVGLPMAVVFIENKTETVKVGNETTRKKTTVEEVINIATIREQLSQRFQITGLDSTEEARNLALLLRAGALAAPIDIIEERTIGPSLGAENIAQGYKAAAIGFALLSVFMVIYYSVFGLFAVLTLLLNVVLVVALLSLLQATLTLPGIAGLLLTVGTAVDANVLIYERIREELRAGNSVQASIQAGFERAFATIADANITSLIAALFLFSFGTGPVKGFAVSLSLGILTSMFTAIIGTRALVNLFYGGRRLKTLPI